MMESARSRFSTASKRTSKPATPTTTTSWTRYSKSWATRKSGTGPTSSTCPTKRSSTQDALNDPYFKVDPKPAADCFGPAPIRYPKREIMSEEDEEKKKKDRHIQNQIQIQQQFQMNKKRQQAGGRNPLGMQN